MKRLRQICAATVLTLLLTNFALAEEGIIHPQYVPPPPVTTQPGLVGPTDEVEIKSEEPATDLEMEITLLLIQNMLALF